MISLGDIPKKIAEFNNVPEQKIRIMSVTMVPNGVAVIYRRIRDDSDYQGECRAAYVSERHEKVTSDHCMREPSGRLTFESDVR